MLREVINQTLFFEGCLAALMAIVQLLQISRDKKHAWFCVFFSCAAFVLFQQFYYGAYGTPDLELARWPGQFVKFLIGPTGFLYFKRLFYREFIFKKMHLVHFIPALIAMCFEFLVLLPGSMLNPAFLNFRETVIACKIDHYYNVLGVVLFAIYLLYTPIKEGLLQRYLHDEKDGIILNMLMLFGFAGVVMSIMIFAILARQVMLARFIGSLSIVPFIVFFIITFHRPEVIPLFTGMIRKKMFERALIKGYDVEVLKNRLNDIMVEDKVFCDEDLTLKRLADMLLISSHRLSELLNKHMYVSFNNYINTLRVNEAVSLMKSQPERSISSICYSVGFNSRSVFYRTFINITGNSPARYRKNLKL